MMVMLGMISGPFEAILLTVITWNPESNCTCPEKTHFLFHRNISTLPELLIRISTDITLECNVAEILKIDWFHKIHYIE